jgi:hypothetical protein
MERLHALLILAWALVRSLLAPLLGARRGLADFRRSYAADRLPPVAADERRYMHELSRCIACGLCDAGEGARIARSHGKFAGVMDLMLASSRSMPDYDAAARSFEAIGDERLSELEARCPVRVPMRKLASFVRGKAAELTAPIEPREPAPAPADSTSHDETR